MFGLGGAEAGVTLFLAFKFVLLVAAIMAIFVPFFIYRIRNETIRMNRRLDAIVDLLGGKSRQVDRLTIGSPSGPVKTCPSCQTENRQEDDTCISCGRDI